MTDFNWKGATAYIAMATIVAPTYNFLTGGTVTLSGDMLESEIAITVFAFIAAVIGVGAPPLGFLGFLGYVVISGYVLTMDPSQWYDLPQVLSFTIWLVLPTIQRMIRGQDIWVTPY